MTQVHKRFTVEQVKVLFQGYLQGNLSRADDRRDAGDWQDPFFRPVEGLSPGPEGVLYRLSTNNKGAIVRQVEAEIQKELLREKALIDDAELPIHDYNYAALADRLKKKGIQVSTTTITKRAKTLDCYRPRKRKRP